MDTSFTVKSVLADVHVTFDAEHVSANASVLAARLLALLPPLALLAAIYLFAVNVPYGKDWDLITFNERILNGALSWTHFVTEPLVAVKVVAMPLALGTDFDVIAQMYAGFGLHLLAFLFLCSVLELTLRAWHQRLIAPLSIATALLMFTTRNYQTWLSGLTSLEWGMSTCAAAALLWLLSRWPAKPFARALCLFLSWIGVLGLPSGAVLWGVVLVAILTRAPGRGKVQWLDLLGWIIGAVFLAGQYVGGFDTMTDLPRLSFLSHPLQSCAFVLVYLGWPLVQGANSWIAGGTGLAGLILLSLAISVWRHHRHHSSDARSILPWVWLSSYAVLAALLAAASRLEEGIGSSFGSEYTAGSFFWIGFAVIAGLTIQNHWPEEQFFGRWLRPMIIIAVIGWSLNSVRLYYEGYVLIARQQNERTETLRALYRYNTVPDEVLASLHPDPNRTRENLQILDRRRLGPFSPRMLDERRRLESATTFATNVIAEQGYLDTAVCSFISGWAWDVAQPNMSVKVDIYDGDNLLLTAPADWFRRDLADAHVGNGRYGFVVVPPPGLRDGHAHAIHARISGAKSELGTSPKQILCQ